MKSILLKSLLALLITLSAAVYQRLTGPTYPMRGKDAIHGREFFYNLPRSHGEKSAKEVVLELPADSFEVHLNWRRYKTSDPWTRVPMENRNGLYQAELPLQPPAGKLEYFIVIKDMQDHTVIPSDETVVIRFRGAVPAGVLIPHILFMFTAMFFSNLSLIEAFGGARKLFTLTLISCILLFLGGMILGPVVQKYAFDAYWTGIPFGYDLTDNKTLVGMVGWLAALVQVGRHGNKGRWWVIGAGLLLLIVFSIPHSMMGSELDYETMDVVTGD